MMNDKTEVKNAELGTLLNSYMERQGWGDLRLATKANKAAGLPKLELSRSTIRNWRAGTTQGVQHWQGLLAVGMALKLNAGEIQELLSVAGLPDLQTLYKQMTGADKRFFTPWHDWLIAPGVNGNKRDETDSHKIKWKNAPTVQAFYGRDEALKCVEDWVLADGCRVIGLLGAGGIGKTCVAVKLALALQDKFDYVLGFSLTESPPLEDVIDEWLADLVEPDEWLLEIRHENKLDRLLYFLRKARCLLILDNLESVMQAQAAAGQFRAEYENYGVLLKRIGETEHQSCLLFTSRECPKAFSVALDVTSAVRAKTIEGLDILSVQRLLRGQKLIGSQVAWERLNESCSGNPKVLQLLSQSIVLLFNGRIEAFLQKQTFVFSDVYDLLAEQFERLPAGEQELLFWLTLEREALTLEQIAGNLLYPVSERKLFEMVGSLIGRFLIKKSDDGFMAENLAKEFLADKFLEFIVEDILYQTNGMLNRYALLKTNTKEYIRNNQKRVFIKPIKEKLIASLGHEESVIRHLMNMLRESRKSDLLSRGYLAGNVINLLVELDADLTNCDFSFLTIWHADFRGQSLTNSNFTHSDLTDSVFTYSFSRIMTVAFNSAGTLFAVGTADSKVQIWQYPDKKLLHVLQGHRDWVRSVLFSDDSKQLISCADDETIRIWDVGTGECRQVLRGHQERVLSLSLIPHTNLLASGGQDHTVRLWNLDTYASCVLQHENITGWVQSLTYDPHSRILVCGDGHRKLHLWQADQKGEEWVYLQSLHGHEHILWCVAFSPNGRFLASSSYDQTIILWDMVSKQQHKMMHSKHGSVRVVVFSPDGKFLVAGCQDGTLQFWNTDGSLLAEWAAHRGSIWCLRFDPAGRILVSGSEDKTIKFWDVASRSCVGMLAGHRSSINNIDLHANNRYLMSSCEDGKARLWDLATSQCLQTYKQHGNWLNSVAFAPGKPLFASGNHDGTIRLWNLSTGKYNELKGHTNSVIVKFSSDGRYLASGSPDQSVRLWDVAQKEAIGQPLKHYAELWDLVFYAHDQRLLTSCADGIIWEWDLQEIKANPHQNVQPCQVFKAATNIISALAVEPMLNLLVYGSHETIYLCDLTTWQLLPTCFQSDVAVRAIALSPNGKKLATAGLGQTISIWCLDTGERLGVFDEHMDTVRGLCFSKDGQTLISGSYDETIKVWEIANGKCLQTLQVERPYENVNLTHATGFTHAQRIMLADLGAIEKGLDTSLFL